MMAPRTLITAITRIKGGLVTISIFFILMIIVLKIIGNYGNCSEAVAVVQQVCYHMAVGQPVPR
jgi:hypothetical protein